MARRIKHNEIELAMKLAGQEFPELDTLKTQLDNSTVTELDDGLILEFRVFVDAPFKLSRSVLGEGSVYDIDGVPVIFTLLQKGGFVWHLDIGRADGARIQRQLDYAQVNALGFGKGLTLEQVNQ